MTVSEKIRILLKRREMTVTKLAERLQISRQYLTKKLKYEDFTVYELHCIADILGCSFEPVFTDKEEKI